MLEFDYIVVGGGTTGGIASARLAEDPDMSVALLEQGPSDWFPWMHIPGMLYKAATDGLLRRMSYNLSEESSSRATATVQGRVLGGGSSVNGMVHVRDTPQDYNGWGANGAAGWSFQKVLPFFLSVEGNEALRNHMHGSIGPLKVSSLRCAWGQAGEDAGISSNPDFNSGSQPGCAFDQAATEGVRRSSGARAYVHPAIDFDGLRVAESVMPTLPSGNTTAACIMVGERTANFRKNSSQRLVALDAL